MPGDVVRRLVAGRSTQRGYCRDVTVYSSVQVLYLQSDTARLVVPNSPARWPHRHQLGS